MKNALKVIGLLWICSPAFATHAPRLELSLLVGGSYIPNTIDGETLELLPYEVGPYADTFTNQSDAGAFTWGVGAKYRFPLHNPSVNNYIFHSWAIGADVFQIIDFDQTGDVLQYNIPQFKNYTYTLGLKSTRFMADVDVEFHPLYKRFIPFIEAGIGAGATSVSYDSDPIPPVTGPEFSLHNKTSWTFAYQAGAGVKYVVNSAFIVSLHYLYANMGKVDSSTSGSATDLAKPITVDMSTQNFLFGFTYAL